MYATKVSDRSDLMHETHSVSVQASYYTYLLYTAQTKKDKMSSQRRKANRDSNKNEIVYPPTRSPLAMFMNKPPFHTKHTSL